MADVSINEKRRQKDMTWLNGCRRFTAVKIPYQRHQLKYNKNKNNDNVK